MKGSGGNWKAENEDLERVIEKSDTSSSINSDDIIKQPHSIREQVGEVIHSQRFQIGVVVLIILDCLLVIGELLIDLKVAGDEANANFNLTYATDAHTEGGQKGAKHAFEEKEKTVIIIAEVLHYCSIAILSIFLLELFLKLFAMGKSFFHHKMEIVDAVIVIVSFALDIAFIEHEDATSGFGLIIILRLWRMGRIVNGIVLSMKARSEKKLSRERSLRQAAEAELVKFREYCSAQEREIEALQILLTQNGIEFQKMEKPQLHISKIDVVAEVNQYIDAAKIASADTNSDTN